MWIAPEDARTHLIAIGKYTDETAPTLEQLEWVLSNIEVELDSWLGYHPGLREYEEIKPTNYRGAIVLAYYPVSEVLEVEGLSNTLVGQPLLKGPAHALWNHAMTLQFLTPNTQVRVRYIAGRDPLPRKFRMVALKVLEAALDTSGTSGDLGFLFQPIRDVQSISVSGINKSFRLSKPATPRGGTEEGTMLDRLLAPLRTEQRKFLF